MIMKPYRSTSHMKNMSLDVRASSASAFSVAKLLRNAFFFKSLTRLGRA
eukprot:CAMPEP_0114235732 /NCGR_PEP_ID=MMETSP0058-20121206/6414_1 /TAXON_ID=36894 /ORGANISM="Pyramimonas parkeae, CCMP726" /LENGTH=48 /DNA_ID= /DNA_START= /DNA_END= /DNA_ORIENTATION=